MWDSILNRISKTFRELRQNHAVMQEKYKTLYSKYKTLQEKYKISKLDYSATSKNYTELQTYSRAQDQEIVRLSSEFIALQKALTHFYDDATIRAILAEASGIDGFALLKETCESFQDYPIQIGLNFFK